MCCLWIRSTKQSRYKLTRAQRLCCLCVVTSVEIIAPFSAGPCPALFAVAVETGQCAGGRAGFGPSSLGLKRRRRFGTGWTAFSSRAFQNLPGASLKQKEAEEEEVGLPVGMLQTNRYPIGTAIFNVDRRSTVTL